CSHDFEELFQLTRDILQKLFMSYHSWQFGSKFELVWCKRLPAYAHEPAGDIVECRIYFGIVEDLTIIFQILWRPKCFRIKPLLPRRIAPPRAASVSLQLE